MDAKEALSHPKCNLKGVFDTLMDYNLNDADNKIGFYYSLFWELADYVGKRDEQMIRDFMIEKLLRDCDEDDIMAEIGDMLED